LKFTKSVTLYVEDSVADNDLSIGENTKIVLASGVSVVIYIGGKARFGEGSIVNVNEDKKARPALIVSLKIIHLICISILAREVVMGSGLNI